MQHSVLSSEIKARNACRAEVDRREILEKGANVLMLLT